MVDAARVAKAAKLLEVATELHEKIGDTLREIDVLLTGGEGIGPQMKALMAAFDAVWGLRYAAGERGRYVWKRPQDHAQAKRLLKMIPLDDLTRRASAYLTDGDPFLVKARHTFGLFVSQVNRWAPAPGAFDLQPGAGLTRGCSHRPLCRDDAEHTARVDRDMREAGR